MKMVNKANEFYKIKEPAKTNKVEKKKLRNKKYNDFLFFVFIMVITAIIGQIIPTFKIFTDKDTLSDRKILIGKNLNSNNNQFIWWDVNDNNMRLNLKNIDEISEVKVYGIVNEGQPDELIIKSGKSQIDMKYSGSFNAVVTPFEYDINNDGRKEEVKLFSKLDTVYVQGMNVKTTFFEKKEIHLEAAQLDFYTVGVKYNGEPLVNKNVKLLYSNDREKDIILDSRGAFKINSLNILKSGIDIIYVADGVYNIINYKIERNSLFTESYFKGLYPLIFVIAVSLDLVLLIRILRYNPFRKKLIIEEINNVHF